MIGILKKLNEKGFGFITPEGETSDVFFHKNSLVGVRFEELNEGEKLSFEVEDSPKGKNAVNVQRVA